MAKCSRRLDKETAILAEIGRIISSTLNIEEVYDRFAKEARKLIPFGRIAINLIDRKRKRITTPYESGLSIPGRHIGSTYPLANSFNEKILQGRKGIIFNPESNRVFDRHFPCLRPVFLAGIRSYLGVPLVYRNEVIGTLQFRSQRPKIFRRHHLRPAERIANQIAGAIANAQLFLKLKHTEKALRASEKQLRILSSHLLSAQEMERRRISRELHDDLGQAMTLLKFQIGYVEKRMPAACSDLRQECAKAQKGIEAMLENIHRISRDLRPSILEDFGLSVALERLAQDFSNHYHVQTSLDLEALEHLTSPSSQVMVYRILQEALTNIGKHAQASRVILQVQRKGDSLRFMVEDDGKGFSPEKEARDPSSTGGLGLATMAERSRILGGTLNVQSEEGKGTRLILTVPIGAQR